jgi:hypothetical protein
MLLLLLLSLLNVQEGNALSRRFTFLSNEFNITPGTSVSDQQLSSVAYNSDDDQWLVAWRDDRNGSNQGIYARRVNKNGALLGTELVIYDNTESLNYPSVAYDKNLNRYLVVWMNAFNYNIEGRLVAADGVLFPTIITIKSCSNCYDPDVVYNPVAHEYMVIWFFGLDNHDIHGRRVDGDGNPGLSDIMIALTPGVNESYPSIAVDSSNGKYLVVYTREVDSVQKIYGRRMLSSGEPDPDSSPFQISDLLSAGEKFAPDVAFNPTTHLPFVSWSSYDGVHKQIQGRMVNADLTLGPQRLFDETDQWLYLAMAYGNIGNSYLVVWYDGYDLYGQWVGPNGGLEGQKFYISSLGESTAVAFGRDRYLVTWTGGSGSADIYGRFGAAYPSMFLPMVIR